MKIDSDADAGPDAAAASAESLASGRRTAPPSGLATATWGGLVVAGVLALLIWQLA